MSTIAVEDLAAQLSAAIARVEAGETLVITRDNIAIAQLVSARLAHTHRGSLVGTGRLQPTIKGGLAGAKGLSLATLSDDRGDRVTFMPSVIRAEYRGEFRIHLVFNDGSQGTIDFRPWFDGPVFEPLADAGYFQRFFIDGGTVAWPNGADIAPETLHEAALASHGKVSA